MKASHLQISLLIAVLAFAAFWVAGGSGEPGSTDRLNLEEGAAPAGRALKSEPWLSASKELDVARPIAPAEVAKHDEARLESPGRGVVKPIPQEIKTGTVDVLVRALRPWSAANTGGLPGVGLHLSFPHGASGAAVQPGSLEFDVTTGNLGTCVLSLPWPESSSPGARRVPVPQVIASEDSHLEVVVARYNSQQVEGKDMLCLDVTLSAVLTGRVVDRAGDPLSYTVEVYKERSDGDWWRRSVAYSDQDGGYRLPVSSEGNYVVRAAENGRWGPPFAMPLAVLLLDAEPKPAPPPAEVGSLLGVGSGVSPVIAVDFEAVPRDIQVVVDGQSILRGRVVDREQGPVSGLRLLALHRDLDDEQYTSFEGVTRLGPQQPGMDQWGQGLWGGPIMTGTDGTFELLGLRPGEYVVRAQPDGVGEVFSELLTRAPVPANGVPLELELTQPRLRVRLVDPAGKVLPDDWQGPLTRVTAISGLVIQGGFLELSVRPITEADSGPTVGRELIPKGIGEGVFEFRPARGSSLQVCIIGLGYPERIQTVHMPKDSGLIEVTVVVDLGLLASD